MLLLIFIQRSGVASSAVMHSKCHKAEFLDQYHQRSSEVEMVASVVRESAVDVAEAHAAHHPHHSVPEVHIHTAINALIKEVCEKLKSIDALFIQFCEILKLVPRHLDVDRSADL